MAMTELDTSTGILEVMGAPLSGTDLRACVMSGGGITLKNFKPSFRSKHCFLIFPIRGSERKSLVSVEVKKKKGQECLENGSLDKKKVLFEGTELLQSLLSRHLRRPMNFCKGLCSLSMVS